MGHAPSPNFVRSQSWSLTTACRADIVLRMCHYRRRQQRGGIALIDITVTDQTMTIVADSDISGPEWVRILADNNLLGSDLSLCWYAVEDDGAEIMHYQWTTTDTTVAVSA